MDSPVLDGDSFSVGNNSMPPVASPRLGTSGCDYPSRIEFDKKRHLRNLLLPLTFGGGNAKLSASFPFGRAMP